MTTKSRTGGMVKSDQTMLQILTTIKRRGEVGVTDLANELDLAKSTVHSHLKTLHDAEFVVKEEGRYRIGLRFLDFGETSRQQIGEYQYIQDKVENLATQTDERAQFIVPEHGRGIFLYVATGNHAVQTDSRIGKRIALNTSSAGKAILAHLPDERVDDIIDRHGLPDRTEQTITDPDRFREELERTRDRGYAINLEETTEGLRAVGVPVLGPSGEVLGALSVSGPSHRLKDNWFESEIPDMILGAANEIELNITFS